MLCSALRLQKFAEDALAIGGMNKGLEWISHISRLKRDGQPLLLEETIGGSVPRLSRTDWLTFTKDVRGITHIDSEVYAVHPI